MPPANRCPQCDSRVDPRDARSDGLLTCPECGARFRAAGSRAVGSNTGLVLLIVLGGGGLVIVLGFLAVIGLWFFAAVPAPAPANPNPVAVGPANPGPGNAMALGPANDERQTYEPFRSVTLPNGPRAMNLLLAPNADGVIGLVREPKEVGVGRISLFDAKTGAPVADVTLKNWSLSATAISPDGKWVAHVRLPHEAVVLTPVADPAAARDFSPRPKDLPEASNANLIWVTFVSADRLLALYRDGGFDIWTVPGFERVAARKGNGGRALKFEGAGQFVDRFAISSDRATCVSLVRGEFVVCDPRTGAERTKFSPFDEDTARQVGPMALSADGTRLACLTTERLIVIDTKTGKVRSDKPMENTAAALGWWGRGHVVAFNSELMTMGKIYETETGVKVGDLQTAAQLETTFTVFGPGDRAWAVNTPLVGPGRFYAFDAPADLKGAKDVRYSVGAKGMTGRVVRPGEW